MIINGVKLNNFQANFLKELSGDPYAPDFRVEAVFNNLCAKHGVDAIAVIEAINKNFAVKNAEFKKQQEAELAKV